MDIIDITGRDIQRAVARVDRNKGVDEADANKGARKKEADSVSVSSRAMLLHQLQRAYEKLESSPPDKNLEEIKERIKEGIYKLSSEEIVVEILRGTIFEVS